MEWVYEHAPELRKDLLESYAQASQGEFLRLDKYYGESDHFFKKLCGLAILPTCLYTWTLASRRVYHLPNDLQTLLEWTSLQEISWGEIEWPLFSFGICLDRPLVDAYGKRYDYLLFCRNEAVVDGDETVHQEIQIILFSTDLENYRGFSKADKQQIEKAISARQTNKIKKLFADLERLDPSSGFTSPIRTYIIDLDQHKDAPITSKSLELASKQPTDDFRIKQHDLIDSAIHIIAGLALYLESLEPNQARENTWQRHSPPEIRNLRCINNVTEVCEVRCEHTLTAKDKAFLDAVNLHIRQHGHTGMPVHWRRGYWRRKPGHGQIIQAKRSVRVSPSLINEHLIKDFLEAGVPVGARHTI
jgi:hypothetical protein